MPDTTPDAVNPVQPVLILIHGATINGHMWDAVRRHLDARYRVLAPDLPGHGSRRGERFTMEGAVATVLAAARSVAPAPVVLAGDSLGGYTALSAAAALEATGQLRGLVVGGCTANLVGLPTMVHFNAKALLIKLLLALFGEEQLIHRTTGKVRKMLADAGVQQTDIDPMIQAGFSLRVFGQAVDALRGVDYRAKLAAIKRPVLLVNGTRDKVMMRDEPAFVAAAQQGTRQVYDCEHGVSMLRSQAFAGLVNRMAAAAA